MDKYDASEQAYKNGYSAGYEAGRRSVGEKKWISVKDRLPSESYGTVLVCHADKFPYNDTEPFVNAMHDRRIVIGSYSEHTGTWYCNMGGILHDITNWMPLPEPPNCGADMRGEEDG